MEHCGEAHAKTSVHLQAGYEHQTLPCDRQSESVAKCSNTTKHPLMVLRFGLQKAKQTRYCISRFGFIPVVSTVLLGLLDASRVELVSVSGRLGRCMAAEGVSVLSMDASSGEVARSIGVRLLETTKASIHREQYESGAAAFLDEALSAVAAEPTHIESDLG
ncbi:hypothetical protein CCYA_CCYA06G1710 [Cyanidiococcus yangmingshanensis]|nr:hypothetical protein CCYA_CCYA06G1710 [Cyanidiococcus yangmingshanensis]